MRLLFFKFHLRVRFLRAPCLTKRNSSHPLRGLGMTAETLSVQELREFLEKHGGIDKECIEKLEGELLPHAVL